MAFASAIAAAASIVPPPRRRPTSLFSPIPAPTPVISFPPQSLSAKTHHHRRHHTLFVKTPSFDAKASRSDRAPSGGGDKPPFEDLSSLPRIPQLPLVWVSIFAAVLYFFSSGRSLAAGAAAKDSSIRASALGLKVAAALRSSGWADEAIVFALATLPVLELRGAIPVGYWMQLHPLRLTVLSILGNMLPVPFIIIYLKRIVAFASRRSASAAGLFHLLIAGAREKAAPVAEFRWLGLMLFVAVPFPGTGAWTGAVVASVLDLPFWSALSANFFGVLLAGLLVNLIMNLGVKHAIAAGLALFVISTFMWSFLRQFKKSFNWA